MIAESSWYHDDSEHAMEEISTPVFALTGKRCRLRFWYAADLGVNGTMRVTVKNDAGSNIALEKQGNATGNWTFATVRLSEGTNVQVTIGLSASGDENYWLAVDDLRFTDCDPGTYTSADV